MRNVDWLLLVGVGLLTVCRWFLATSMELTEEEALFWMESQRLGTYYIDHGPLVPGLIRLSTAVFGDSLWGVRYWNPLLILLATWLLYLLARSVCHQVVARWVVVVFQLLPWVNVAGVMMLDQALAVSLMLLGYWWLWRGLHRANPWHGAWWGGGLAFGMLGTLSVPLGYSVLLGVAAAMFLVDRWEGQWRRPGLWILLGLGFLLPLMFMIASGHAILAWRALFKDLSLHPEAWLANVAQGFWWTGPLVCLGFGWVGRRWRLALREHAVRLFAFAGVVPLVLMISWAGLVGAHGELWWVVTVPCLVVLVSAWLAADLPLHTKGLWRRWALGTTGLLAIVGVNTATVPTWPEALRTPRLTQGWEETASSVSLMLGEDVFLVAESPGSAALLDFYLPRSSEETSGFHPDRSYPRVQVVESSGWDSSYAFWPSYSHALPGGTEVTPYRDATCLYLGKVGDVDALPQNLTNAFRAVEVAAIIEVRRRQRLLHGWTFFHAYDYQGLPL